MQDKKKKLGGLILKEKDPRNLKLGAIIKLPALSELPKEFILEPLEVKHQGDSDFCSSYASCLLSELQEGVQLEPSWTFAFSKEMTGDPEEWGQSLYAILKAHREAGALKKADSPLSLETSTTDTLRYLKNWPSHLKALAFPQRKKTYFEVSGKYDSFDNIRASIWYFRKQQKGVLIGVQFGWSLSQIVMDTGDDSGFGHAMAVIGFTEREGKEYLVVQNSYGKEAGENGRHYFSREVINKFVDRYGAFMMTDIPRESADQMIATGTLISDNWVIGLLKASSHFFKDLFLRFFNRSEYDKTGGKPRSPKWRKVREEFIRENPTCALCGGTDDLDVHHVKSFALYPELELEKSNLITLCTPHHLLGGHLMSWKKTNSTVREDCTAWYNKIKC